MKELKEKKNDENYMKTYFIDLPLLSRHPLLLLLFHLFLLLLSVLLGGIGERIVLIIIALIHVVPLSIKAALFLFPILAVLFRLKLESILFL